MNHNHGVHHIDASLAKSAFQIAFCITLFFGFIKTSAVLLLIAAILGVIEEFV